MKLPRKGYGNTAVRLGEKTIRRLREGGLNSINMYLTPSELNFLRLSCQKALDDNPFPQTKFTLYLALKREYKSAPQTFPLTLTRNQRKIAE